MSVDAYTCLVFPATSDGLTGLWTYGWRPGPLPIVIPARNGQTGRTVADRAARATYFASRIQAVLYGDGSLQDQNVRWHSAVTDVMWDGNGSRLENWELLRYDADDLLFLVAHIRLGPDPIGSLGALSSSSGPGRDWLEEHVPAPIRLDDGRPRGVSHLVWDGPTIPPPPLSAAAAQAVDRWTSVQQWQWFLASGVAPEAALPDDESPDLADGLVWLSHDWRALVLRNGISYVATTPYRSSSDAPPNSFHRTARSYVRTLHLDALLLGVLQLTTLQRHADATSLIGDGSGIDTAHIAELEARLLRIRARVWWQDITRSGGQVGGVLRAFQSQHRTAALYSKIVEDLTDAARYTLARQAALTDAARDWDLHVEERREAHQRLEDERQRAFERSLAVVSFILLPTSLIFSAMGLWAEPSPGLLMTGVALSGIFVVVTLAASRELRKALRKRPTAEEALLYPPSVDDEAR